MKCHYVPSRYSNGWLLFSELCRAKENLAPDRNKVTRTKTFFGVVYELQTEGLRNFI